MKRVRRVTAVAMAASGILLAGCGAAYYGTALGIIATQDDDETDLSFPDAAPSSPRTPGFATVQLGTTLVTASRTDSNGNTISVTDFPVTSIDFPPGFGESLSNRDAGTSLLLNDRLVVRINDDTSQAILVTAAEVASTGPAVAASLQLLVRGLSPISASVPTEAYSQFTATYDPATGSYRFVSGAPAELSEVVWEPASRGGGDAVPDALSATTAARLGLGVSEGGIEVQGGQSVQVTVHNSGTDVAGGSVNLYLSKDKILDSDDLAFGTMTGPGLSVGEARRFFHRSGAPTSQILRFDIAGAVTLDSSMNPVPTPRSGAFYILFDVPASGGESLTANNLIASNAPIEIYQPMDEPLSATVEVADALDFSLGSSFTPISQVTGEQLKTSFTLTNLGAATTAASSIAVETIISTDTILDEPALFSDPAAVLAGARINPTDPNRAFTVVLDNTGPLGSGITATPFGNQILVLFEAGVGLTVQDLINALNGGTSGALVQASSDGVGTPTADTLDALFTALPAPTALAQDIFLGSSSVTFPIANEQQTLPFTVSELIPTTLFSSGVLPLKVYSFLRITPPVPAVDPENPRNNVRQSSNFIKLFDRNTATFDPDGGLFLPTDSASDFAVLDAVTFRPVNVDSISQGQQRVFRFSIPDTGLTQNEAQVLILLTTDNFDPHLDLLSSSGDLLSQSDDTALGTNPVIYTSLQANGSNRNFYLVVSSARFDESDLAGGTESFALTISVNVREPGDLALVAASGGADVNAFTNQRYLATDPRVENKVLVPFSLKKAKGEVAFYLPHRARVRVSARPVFLVQVNSVFSQFTPGQVASVDHQAVLGTGFDSIVFRPSGGDVNSFHTLDAGAYTMAFSSVNNMTDDQDFRLEIEAQFIPD